MPKVNKLAWVAGQLVNDEFSSDEEMREYFLEEGLSPKEADCYVQQRNAALRNPLEFKLRRCGDGGGKDLRAFFICDEVEPSGWDAKTGEVENFRGSGCHMGEPVFGRRVINPITGKPTIGYDEITLIGIGTTNLKSYLKKRDR